MLQLLCNCMVDTITIVSQKSTMGGAPYKSAKEGGGRSFERFHLSPKEHPCHVYIGLMPSKQITGQTIVYNGNTSGFEVES